MCDDKRKRSPNWLPAEKKLLLDIVEEHFGVVENKKTDGVTMKAKLVEWRIISNEYNSQTTYCHREAENLKAQWENMKKAAKKEASHTRMRMIQTGGGPPDTKKEDPVYSRIISLIKTSAVGLYNPNDNDSVVPVQADSQSATTTTCSETEYLPGSCNIDLNKIIDVDQPLPMIVELSVQNEENRNDLLHTPESTQLRTNVDQDVQKSKNISVLPTSYNDDVTMKGCEIQTKGSLTKDWGDYNPQLLKTPVSALLKTANNKTGISRRRPLRTPATTSIELLHNKKIQAIDLQKILAMQESDRNKMISQIDLEIKKEILKQEKLKTRLLLLELRRKRELKENPEYKK